jgi:hypothetical protein
MKVGELMELLADFDPEAHVHIQYNYGDYWRTQVAPQVSSVGDGQVSYSDYHRMDKVVETDVEDDLEDQTPDPRVRNVVLIG